MRCYLCDASEIGSVSNPRSNKLRFTYDSYEDAYICTECSSFDEPQEIELADEIRLEGDNGEDFTG